MREERIARLLDDPEKLRELRQQRAERKAGKQQKQGPAHEHAMQVAGQSRTCGLCLRTGGATSASA